MAAQIEKYIKLGIPTEKPEFTKADYEFWANDPYNEVIIAT